MLALFDTDQQHFILVFLLVVVFLDHVSSAFSGPLTVVVMVVSTQVSSFSSYFYAPRVYIGIRRTNCVCVYQTNAREKGDGRMRKQR